MIISDELGALMIHIINLGKTIKKKIQFCYYQIIKCIKELIVHIKENIN